MKWIYAIAIALTGCPKKDKVIEVEGNPAVYEVESHDQSPVQFAFDIANGIVTIEATLKPDDVALTCQISDQVVDHCENGGQFLNLEPGEHEMNVLYELAGKHYTKKFYFHITDDHKIDQAIGDRPKSGLKIEPIEEAKDYTPNHIVENDQDLRFAFAYSEALDCQATLKCSFNQQKAVPCAKDPHAQEFMIRKETLTLGVQNLKVYAHCTHEPDDPFARSNEIEFTYYVVEKGYVPLQLSERKAGRYLIFSPKRYIDCFGSIGYECTESEAGEAMPCPNMYLHQNPPHKIRAVCKNAATGEILRGPDFLATK